jgi:hypothetical protein
MFLSKKAVFSITGYFQSLLDPLLMQEQCHFKCCSRNLRAFSYSNLSQRWFRSLVPFTGVVGFIPALKREAFASNSRNSTTSHRIDIVEIKSIV